MRPEVELAPAFELLHHAVDYWAAAKPNVPAIVNATRGAATTWSQLQQGSLQIAASLVRMGFRKGDLLAGTLPLSTEHILLEYACFRLGVVHVPLDLRLSPAEVLRCVRQVRPRAYAFSGRPQITEIAPEVEYLFHFAQPGDHFPGATTFQELMSGEPGPIPEILTAADGAQIIFTTGSTGSPKPALLSHEGILCQNNCLGRAFRFGPDQRVMCNLPASHVGGQAELLLTTLATGGTAVTLETFDPALSLRAIEEHRVTLLGQIPAMFQMEWRSSEFGKRNLSSLQTVAYGGQSVPEAFLQRMLTMAPRMVTGLGLTEASGFCTYTLLTSELASVGRSLGWAAPEYPMSIREPMLSSGRAGSEMGNGEMGHICFRGPQNFLGYVGDPEATAAALSLDGWLYTGDLGSIDQDGLRLAGRAKWILKPRGYQVFPGDIEEHFSRLTDAVQTVGVVGHEHEMWSEAIVAFVEKRPGATLLEADLRRHARSLAAYMRPSHYVVVEAGQMPLNRSAKVDIQKLHQLAREEVAALRARGRWDRQSRDN